MHDAHSKELVLHDEQLPNKAEAFVAVEQSLQALPLENGVNKGLHWVQIAGFEQVAQLESEHDEAK